MGMKGWTRLILLPQSSGSFIVGAAASSVGVYEQGSWMYFIYYVCMNLKSAF